MLEQMEYLWAVVLVLSVVAEAMTGGLVSIWFIPSALVSGILAMCGVRAWIQVLVFFALSLVCIILSRLLYGKLFKQTKPQPTNAQAIIGRRAVVTEEIDNLAAKGTVSVGGQIWTARAKEETKRFQAGQVVTVVAIEGVKLICVEEEA